MEAKIPEHVIEILGKYPGPTSIIIAGVHGNETCGVNAIKTILPKLKINYGKLLIAYGNPKAIQQNVRFTEANLNRMFSDSNKLSKKDRQSYEFKRAKYLKKYLSQSDALLDLHGSATRNSKPFIICERNSKIITGVLPVKTLVYGFDKVEPGGTDYFMNSIGKIGICLECGYFNDKKSIKVATENIMAFIFAQGHIKRNLPVVKNKLYIEIYSLYKTKTSSFKLVKNFSDFEKISKGQIIGIDGDKKITAKKNSIILFARNRYKIKEEAFLLGQYLKRPLR